MAVLPDLLRASRTLIVATRTPSYSVMALANRCHNMPCWIYWIASSVVAEAATAGKDGLLNHLGGLQQHVVGNCQTERPRGLEVDDEFELAWLLHGQVSGLGALEDLPP